ncbi:hypothetical protein BGZ68_004603 [Mortierella alpina]|nr:hypothetical protein BGZ68_004603 [Mortierella alpina]
MICIYLKRLILSLSFATPATLAAPIANETSPDACGSLGAKQGVNLTYDDVTKCYKAIPFDSKIVASTMKTVLTFVSDHYSFRDHALTPNLKSPFSSPPVDIMKELMSIETAKLPNMQMISASTQRYPLPLIGCMMPMPVMPSIRVFKDPLNRGYDDCEVKKINGQDAFAYLSNWSSSLKYSKDAGVRLNEALASQRLEGYGENEGFVTEAGAFATRSTLPEAPHIDYEIQCGPNSKAVALRENWKVVVASDENDKSNEHLNFNNVQEYVTKVCLRSNSSDVDYKLSQASNMDSASLSSPPLRKSADMRERLRARRVEDAHPQFPGAELIMSYTNSKFFILKAHPKIAVVVVPTHIPARRHPQQYENLIEGLIELHKRNVTNVLIDVQGNGGGAVDYAYWLVRAFFPNKDGFDISLLSDVRAPKIVQELAAAAYQQKGQIVFDASRYIDLKTKEPYSSTAMFTHPVEKTVNGHTDTYSQLAIEVPPPTKTYQELDTFPWTNKPASIHILTDGRCGSACGLSTHMFSAYKNVSVTAIGGMKDQPLSMFSFVGGVVLDLDDILESYKEAGVKSSMENLPYTAWLRLPVTLKYAQNSNVPLEYDSAHHPAKLRLDFDPKHGRDRVAMWTQVATKVWNL